MLRAEKQESFLGREEELNALKAFTTSAKSGFVYVRGRRRVGKSRLLKKLAATRKDIFYFQGAEDSNKSATLADFASAWDSFSEKIRLTELSPRSLTWRRIFEEISQQTQQNKKNLVLIFDEIQWIAKTQSGCVGAIKAAWLDWEQLGIKVIICGSSNKFFVEQTGGEEKILRGLTTRSTIWIHPFSLHHVKALYFPKWKNEEVALTYMLLGGIPYYLQRIIDQGSHREFMHCINDAVFTKESIFLEEIDELLGLEFNKRGTETVKRILASLGQDGKTQTEIQKITGIPKQTISDMLGLLVEYKLVFEKSPAHETKRNYSGIRYFMKDFYLNFYFQVLLPNKYKIETNSNGFVLGDIFERNSNYFIPNFSGKAFELLVRYILEQRIDLKLKIFNLLDLRSWNYEVLAYWNKETQIDLLVEHKTDRLSRILECKWVGPDNRLFSQYLDELLSKKYEPPKTYTRKPVLVISKKPTLENLKKAKDQGVTIVSLDDLFLMD